ncbi:hypothetical protein VTN00DRAFT_5791 [Thermoascus crustaceus]|uniref:uncharacterized protein n=1 Tax=Thermoascus crustaceus TaxID=5088 RepID=UPI003743CA6C
MRMPASHSSSVLNIGGARQKIGKGRSGQRTNNRENSLMDVMYVGKYVCMYDRSENPFPPVEAKVVRIWNTLQRQRGLYRRE